MRVLYHFPLDPGSRKLRIQLSEKGLAFELKVEKAWERREDFLRLNPAGEVPVLIEEGRHQDRRCAGWRRVSRRGLPRNESLGRGADRPRGNAPPRGLVR